MCLFGGISGALLMIVLAHPICVALKAQGAESYIRLVALSLPLAQYNELAAAFLDRDLRYRVSATAQIIGSAGSLGVALGALSLGAGGAALILQAVAQQSIRFGILLAGKPAAVRPAFHREPAKQVWGIGRHLMAAAVLNTVFLNADNAIVSAERGAIALGGYAFVYNLATLTYWLVGQTSNRVLGPIYARVKTAVAEMAGLFVTAFRTIAVVSALPLGFLVVAGPAMIDVLFQNKWHAFGLTLRLLAIFAWFRTLTLVGNPILVLTNRVVLQQRIQAVQLAVMLPTVALLTFIAGTQGAASGVLIAAVLGATYMLVVLRSAIDLRWPQVSTPLLLGTLCGAASGGAGRLVLFVVDNRLLSVVSLLAAVVAWLAAWALLDRSSLRFLVGHLLPER
jgi:O-antigen/teichoic acid export membrane protein